MSEQHVGNIHRRFYLTLINPSSQVTTVVISLLCAAVLVLVSYVYYLHLELSSLGVVLPLSLGVMYLANLLDFAALRGLPVAKLAKIHHTAAFANILWLATVALGVAASFVFAREASPHFLVEGMMVAISFRICVFRSVFGAGLPGALLLSPVLPLAFFASFVPSDLALAYLSDATTLGLGLALPGIIAVWSVVADRAGRPGVASTFKLLQAYLLAWTEQNTKPLESIMEGKAKESSVSTYTLAFQTTRGRSLMVLPDLHPGPFYPVGGSNLPYEIYNLYSSNSNAVVMHSISDHSLNLPSRQQVERYLSSLNSQQTSEKGNTCTEPVVIQVNKARITGIAFGKVAVLMLSYSPHGMEDVPEELRSEIENYAKSRGFSNALVIDTHNAMGGALEGEELSDMAKACSVTLDELVKKKQSAFKFGFCRSAEIGASAEDLGPAGMGVMTITIENHSFAIGWADANNMVPGLREQIVSHLASNNISMLEVCTSDTHYTSGKARNRTGYFTFGSLSSSDAVSGWYMEMAKKAHTSAEDANYDLTQALSQVKIMGPEQFSDYSNSLDKGLNVTKAAFVIAVISYIAMFVAG